MELTFKEELKKYANAESCPVRNVLNRIGDKWSILVILLLGDLNVLRFNELHRSIGTISQKMLTVTLKTLETDGLVKRTIYPQVPPKVEYELTERGHSLLPIIQDLVCWAKDNMDEIKELRGKNMDE